MKKVPLSEVKDDLSLYLRLAETERIVITRHGKPAGVLIGFQSDDDWFDYRQENDPAFQKGVANARRSVRRESAWRANNQNALNGPVSTSTVEHPSIMRPQTAMLRAYTS